MAAEKHAGGIDLARQHVIGALRPHRPSYGGASASAVAALPETKALPDHSRGGAAFEHTRPVPTLAENGSACCKALKCVQWLLRDDVVHFRVAQGGGERDPSKKTLSKRAAALALPIAPTSQLAEYQLPSLSFRDSMRCRTELFGLDTADVAAGGSFKVCRTAFAAVFGIHTDTLDKYIAARRRGKDVTQPFRPPVSRVQKAPTAYEQAEAFVLNCCEKIYRRVAVGPEFHGKRKTMIYVTKDMLLKFALREAEVNQSFAARRLPTPSKHMVNKAVTFLKAHYINDKYRKLKSNETQSLLELVGLV